jgi:hypothetical protein
MELREGELCSVAGCRTKATHIELRIADTPYEAPYCQAHRQAPTKVSALDTLDPMYQYLFPESS